MAAGSIAGIRRTGPPRASFPRFARGNARLGRFASQERKLPPRNGLCSPIDAKRRNEVVNLVTRLCLVTHSTEALPPRVTATRCTMAGYGLRGRSLQGLRSQAEPGNEVGPDRLDECSLGATFGTRRTQC